MTHTANHWTRLAGLMGLVLVSAAPLRAQAAGPRAEAVATVSVQVLAPSAATTLLGASAPTVAAVSGAYLEITAPVQIQANTAFRVQVQGTAAAANVQVLGADGRYTPLTSSAITVLRGPATGGVWRGVVRYRVPRPGPGAETTAFLPVRYTVSPASGATTLGTY